MASWLDQQFNTPPLDKHWDYVARGGPRGCNPCDSRFINAAMESFWLQAIQGEDQLRQRVVFALSQIFVVSTVNSSVDIQPDAHASYLDMLSRNAFGSFRDLLEDVTLHPTMGHYLSHIRNRKGDPQTGRTPDENYAREVMQLFSVGLWQLNPDGTRRKDNQGRDIPTYDQEDVMGMARVLTGWSWGGPDASEERWHGWIGGGGAAWALPMQPYPQFHEDGEKRLLALREGGSKTVVPAGTDATQSLKVALDALADHPNVGPFIGSQLIQRLVTSNPSPAYVARVTAAFNDNGRGVRGDLKAVLRAVLLDPEARNDDKLSDPRWGKLREPMIRYANWMRSFDARSQRGVYQIWNLENPSDSLGQNPLRAPSVFNWYRPSYMPPGPLREAGVKAPEFQITHETTITGYTNFIVNLAERGTPWFDSGPNAVVSSYAAQLGLGDSALVDQLNLLLVAGQMSDRKRNRILDVLAQMPGSDPRTQRRRVSVAVALTMASPEYTVQR